MQMGMGETAELQSLSLGCEKVLQPYWHSTAAGLCADNIKAAVGERPQLLTEKGQGALPRLSLRLTLLCMTRNMYPSDGFADVCWGYAPTSSDPGVASSHSSQAAPRPALAPGLGAQSLPSATHPTR